MRKIILALGVLLLAVGCASTSGVDRKDKNQFVVEFFATVTSVNKVKFRSHAGQAIAIGAAVGAASQSGDDKKSMFGGAIIGGLVGGVFSAIFEGSPDGYEYALSAVDGDEVKVIVDHNPAQVGDCVEVRVSGTVSLALTEAINCSTTME